MSTLDWDEFFGHLGPVAQATVRHAVQAERARLLAAIRALPSFDKETRGGWMAYDEMVEQDTSSWEGWAGEWLRRDDVLNLLKEEKA